MKVMVLHTITRKTQLIHISSHFTEAQNDDGYYESTDIEPATVETDFTKLNFKSPLDETNRNNKILDSKVKTMWS